MKSEVMDVSHEQLLAWLDYDPETGHFTWRVNKPKRHAMEGRKAGAVLKDGYLSIELTISGNRTRHLAHRLAWFYVYGVLPTAMIDHLNGIKSDNRISNIREASRSQNVANTPPRKDNLLGVKGVSMDAAGKKYRARIKLHGKAIWLGCYDTIEEATAAYKSAAQELYGEFARF